MSEEIEIYHQNAKVAKILHYYFSTGESLKVIAEKFKSNEMTISNIISTYMKAFRGKEIKTDPAEQTEEDILMDKKLSDRKFYEFTKLDPSNRWWVNKGSNMSVGDCRNN